MELEKRENGGKRIEQMPWPVVVEKMVPKMEGVHTTDKKTMWS